MQVRLVVMSKMISGSRSHYCLCTVEIMLPCFLVTIEVSILVLVIVVTVVMDERIHW